MIYCFDLDGTLCNNTDGFYEKATPFTERIQKVNLLYDEGHYIIIDTARGSTTGIDWYDVTKKQLDMWGIKYHKLIVGKKIHADIFIDDKSINDKIFFKDGK
jgi:hypothetical protein